MGKRERREGEGEKGERERRGGRERGRNSEGKF